ncbi:dipeptidase [Anaerotignum sp.]|uniref:dipeptidase n=1 Tax=Anaerotignum sp. TaxID=2039241 RepID=UPI0028AF55E9|nr:dipeptidase [Anaerotignum sp.]
MRSYGDGHCDTIVRIYEKGQELFCNDGHIDIQRLTNYKAPLQFFAIWLEPRYYPIAMRQTMKYIEFYYNQIQKNADLIGHINCFDDLEENKKKNKISALLSIEGGEALEGEISAIHTYHRLGVRSMSLTWNHRNQLADGVAEKDSKGGLTKFGRDAVAEMEQLGMIVDVSHLSEPGFWDVYNLAKRPFIASHSNAKTICDVPRNLTDNQMRAIADKGGVIGLNLYPPFLTTEKEVEVEDIFRHIHHILSVVGEDFVALGTDFDGIDCCPKGISDVKDMDYFFTEMENEYGEQVVEKICSKNLLRVLAEVI